MTNPVPLPIVEDVVSAFYLHMEVADRPGVLAQIAQHLGEQQAHRRLILHQQDLDLAFQRG